MNRTSNPVDVQHQANRRLAVAQGMIATRTRSLRLALSVGVLIGGLNASDVTAQAASAIGAVSPVSAGAPAHKASPYHPVSLPNRARTYYQAVWGIDNLLVHTTASGNLIRFSYRVTNPEQATPLNSKQATPYLYGQRSGAVLQVPVMDKVGDLRQTGKQETGQDYWMVFSNKGNWVKAGDRVDVVIGNFRAVGLRVE